MLLRALSLSVVAAAAEDPLLTMNDREVAAVRAHLLRLRTPPPPPPPLPPRPPPPPHPPSPPPSPPPYLAYDFEALPDGWSADIPGSDLPWTWQVGPPPSRTLEAGRPLTGPARDHTHTAPAATRQERSGKRRHEQPAPASAGGHYYYVEASGRVLGDEAWLGGPLPLECVASVGFSFHMFGVSMGSLELRARTAEGEAWATLWRADGQSAGGSTGDAWRRALVPLTPPMRRTGGASLRFVGTVGDGYLSDISIDDLEFEKCAAPPPPPPPLVCNGFCHATAPGAACASRKCAGCAFCREATPQLAAAAARSPRSRGGASAGPSAPRACCSFDKCGSCPESPYCSSGARCEIECGGMWCELGVAGAGTRQSS